MCGIAGYILKENDKHPIEDIDHLLKPIRPRGPDDEGVCLVSRQNKSCKLYKTDKTVASLTSSLIHIQDKSATLAHDLALIHTRYSIIDLSSAGHQPFLSRDKSVIAVFNGEIYNYLELRKELETRGVQFKTSSDTEVLVEGYCILKDKIWSRLNGFWAVALYDFRQNSVVLSRDRVGVAPLYYREMPKGFYFASSIQSLIDISPNNITPNQDVIEGFIQCGIKDHDGSTYYSEIKTLPSKTTITFKSDQTLLEKTQHQKYWDFPQQRLTQKDISFSEAVEKYRKVFFDSVNIRLRADVKVAFELSGGLDSSSIVAAAAILRNNNVTTYTAKVKDADEEPYARSILKKYPVDYHVIEPIENDFIKHYVSFNQLMEEPYDNPNAYTHHKMLQIMKSQGVAVVVTGAGGDEVLAGYEASFWPKAYAQLKQEGVQSYLQADWYEFCRRFKTFKTSKETLKHYCFDSFKRFKRIPKTQHLEKNITSASKHLHQYQNMTFHQRSLYHFNIALVPFYMRSSDHFTMGIPVEHRFPFLDYRMIELGLQLPPEYLFKNGWTKYILRKAMEPYLPKKILWRRKKMGFTFPYALYFKRHQVTFEPILNNLKKDLGSYDALLKTNPILLWRLLSTGIWMENR